VRATSQARDLCLSLRRAFAGPGVLARLRADEAATLGPDELRLALGLAWAAGDLALVLAGLGSLPRDRIEADSILSAFLDAALPGHRPVARQRGAIPPGPARALHPRSIILRADRIIE
jgi:hypothetical protein